MDLQLSLKLVRNKMGRRTETRLKSLFLLHLKLRVSASISMGKKIHNSYDIGNR